MINRRDSRLGRCPGPLHQAAPDQRPVLADIYFVMGGLELRAAKAGAQGMAREAFRLLTKKVAGGEGAYEAASHLWGQYQGLVDRFAAKSVFLAGFLGVFSDANTNTLSYIPILDLIPTGNDLANACGSR